MKNIKWCDGILTRMTRIRSPHDFHETKKHDTESICAKGGKITPEIHWNGRIS